MYGMVWYGMLCGMVWYGIRDDHTSNFRDVVIIEYLMR